MYHTQIVKLKKKTAAFMSVCREKDFLLHHNANEGSEPTNEHLKRFLDEWQAMEHPSPNIFSGANDSNEVILSKANTHNHLIPPKCNFFNTNIKQFNHHKKFDAKSFDLITLDPPWWNKYVRRSRNIQRTNG